MNLFALISLFIATASHADDCVFSVNGPLRLSTIQNSVSTETDAMTDALHSAEASCAEAGWTDCSGPSYTLIFREFASSEDQFKVRYAASVSSAECKAANGVRPKKAKMATRVVRALHVGDCLVPTAGPVAAVVHAPKTGDCRDVEPVKNQNTSREIPGDGDGTGRNRRN
jgi:L-asparaginase II